MARAPRSLTYTIALSFAAASTVLLAAAAILLYFLLAHGLDSATDRFLANRAAAVKTMIENEPIDEEEIREIIEIAGNPRARDQIYLRIVKSNGDVLIETTGMGAEAPREAFTTIPVSGPSRARGADYDNNRPMRLYATSANAYLKSDGIYHIEGAADHSQARRLLTNFRLYASLITLAGAAIAVILSVWITKRTAVAPVVNITNLARRVGAKNLNERISFEELPKEIGDLASTFNEMLDRLQTSFDRLSRFSADLAHELRTPISNLRVSLEVSGGRPRTEQEYKQLLDSCLENILNLDHIINSLLFLARAESETDRPHLEPVDLAAEFESLEQIYEPIASSANIQFTREAPAGLAVAADRTLLRRALVNLITNALDHTKSGGKIKLRAQAEPPYIHITVSDDGVGIAAEHLPRVFDRFYKVDPSRRSALGGAGLGLSIVKSIVEIHGGRASILSRPGEGTSVTLQFHAAPSEPPPSRASNT